MLRCCSDLSHVLLELDILFGRRTLFGLLLLTGGSICRRDLYHILEVLDPLFQNLRNILVVASIVGIIVWLFLMRHLHLQLLIILRHVESLGLREIDILCSLVFSVAGGLSSLGLANLSVWLTTVGVLLSFSGSRFELIRSNLLLVHQEIRITLDLLPLATSSSGPSSRCIGTLEVDRLSSLHLWCSFDFEDDSVVGQVLLVLSGTLSSTSLLVVFLLLLLLQEQLLFFQNLYLVRILDRG